MALTPWPQGVGLKSSAATEVNGKGNRSVIYCFPSRSTLLRTTVCGIINFLARSHLQEIKISGKRRILIES